MSGRASDGGLGRLPVLGPLLRLPGYVAFAGPRSTTAVGIALLFGLAAIHLTILAQNSLPTYLAVYFAVLAAATVVAAVAMSTPRRIVAALGWAFGSLISAAALAMYLTSRFGALPDLGRLSGRWDYAPGTVTMALAGAFLALHGAVLLGMAIPYPRRREWHD